MSDSDLMFKHMCGDIINNGFSSEGQIVRPKWSDGTPAHTIKVFGVVNRYRLYEEFPAMTLRPLAFKSCIEEILWIWQKKDNNVGNLKSRIWDAWSDAQGSIGKAYGYQLGKKFEYNGKITDQVDLILDQLKNTPYSRRMVSNIFVHEDLKDMGLEPCVWSVTFNVVDGRLNAIVNQRSQDVLAANNWNVCQYAILIHMMAQVSGLKVGEMVHVIADAHIYDRHIPAVKEMLARETRRAPKLIMNKDIKNFYDFTVDDFKLEGYEPHEQIKNIPIAE